MLLQRLLHRSSQDRERIEKTIADRLDGPMTVLGILFVLLVLAETVTPSSSPLTRVFVVAGWILWLAFVAEFALRMVIAPSALGFLRRNWWQLLFLALPFLRFLRVLSRVPLYRISRAGRVFSSAVRGTRTAGRVLTGRLAWLGVVSLIVTLASSQVLFEFGGYDSYATALHDAAYATITGEPMTSESDLARVFEIALAVYSVVVFASLAGMLGAFFLQRGAERGAVDG